MIKGFAEVAVAAHDALPDGFSGRWKQAGDSATVAEAYYSPDEGPDGIYRIAAAWSDGRRTTAVQVPVEDSAAGLSLLVIGGDLGLRLWRDGGAEWAEPYLLLAR